MRKTVSQPTLFPPPRKAISARFSCEADIVFAQGEAYDLLKECPDGFANLVITSPPYNLGKEYEVTAKLEHYLAELCPSIAQLKANQ
ncbi:MAG: hypothetical protein WC058_11655 [Phycisphaeraceae bacterium]